MPRLRTVRSGDTFALSPGSHVFYDSPSGWLVAEAVRAINRPGKEAQRAFEHVIAVLSERRDATKALVATYENVPHGDIALRWTLLHCMGKAGGPDALAPLAAVALERLPAHDPKGGCATPRLDEGLIRTAAVEALLEVSMRHEKTGETILGLLQEYTETLVRIEAVKAARALGLDKALERALSEKNRWILDIRKAETKDFAVEFEQGKGRETRAAPVIAGVGNEAPRGCGCASGRAL